MHTLQSSDRQKEKPSSDVWISVGYSVHNEHALLATALCVTCTHSSDQWLLISASWLSDASEDPKDACSMLKCDEKSWALTLFFC